MNTQTALEVAIIAAVRATRDQLAQVETIHAFELEITASGRVHDGSVLVKFSVAPNEYGSAAVQANDLQSAIDELLHRHGWEKRHAPLEITFATSEPGQCSEQENACEQEEGA